MEQTTGNNRWKSRTPSLILIPYLRVVFVIVTGFTALNFGIGRLAGNTTAPSPDPFAAFADVFPGQPRSAVVERGFTCPMSAYGAYPNSAEETCILWPKAGAFAQVGVVIAQDVIRQITFTIREDTLRLGDLVARRGMPDVGEMGHTPHFFWSNTGVMASTSAHTGRFSPFLPVRSVSFADASLPTVLNEGS